LIDVVKIIISKHTPEKQQRRSKEEAKKQQRSSKEAAKKKQRRSKEAAKKQQITMTFFDLFLFTILLIIFTGHMMAWIMSFFYSPPPVNRNNRDNYVNPYRLVPRKETEEYKRYERQQYLDSLRR
jgi:cation transport ATPase